MTHWWMAEQERQAILAAVRHNEAGATAEEDTVTPASEEHAARSTQDQCTAPLVGLCGLAQAGKDTFAGYLGYRRIAFADPLKELALRCNPTLSWNDAPWGYIPVRLASLVRQFGWEDVKVNTSDGRQFLQDLGLGVRDILGEYRWVEAAFRQYDPGVPTVITDCRFENEFRTIRGMGGVIVRIERHGQGSPDGHVSEQAWKALQPDYWFTFADGAFADMQRAAEDLDAELRSER